jgi:hypothetical protein
MILDITTYPLPLPLLREGVSFLKGLTPPLKIKVPLS